MPIVRALLGLLIGCLMGAATAYIRYYWRRARWHRHEGGTRLIGYVRDGSWLVVQLWFGCLEWGEFPGPGRPVVQVTYLRPRWMR